MAEEKKTFKWVKPDEPTPEIYTNFVHATWSLFDVRVILGQLEPVAPGDNNDFVVRQKGSVSFAWAQAKVLRDMLNGLVESYEKTNGEIKPLKIAPSPKFASSVVPEQE